MPKRLHELEVHVVGKTADVVVRLDDGVVVAPRLDDVGVQRALHQEARVLQVARHLLEHPDECLADDLALALGFENVVERVKKPVGGLDVHQVDVELTQEGLFHLFGFAESQQAGVDEYARELVTDRLVHERGRDGRVDTARQPADHSRVSHLLADLVHRLLDDRGVRPRRPATAHLEQEPLEHVLAVLGVGDLGVELHAVDRVVTVFQRGDGRGGARRGGDEAGRRGGDRVAVAHPHVLLRGKIGEQG